MWCLWLIYKTFVQNFPFNSDKITERKKSEGQAEENYKQRNLFLEIFLKLIKWLNIQERMADRLTQIQDAVNAVSFVVQGRAVGRSDNPGVPVVILGHNLPPWLR